MKLEKIDDSLSSINILKERIKYLAKYLTLLCNINPTLIILNILIFKDLVKNIKKSMFHTH